MMTSSTLLERPRLLANALAVNKKAFLAFLYLLTIAPFALVMCFVTPPNNVPDEWSHFLRSQQISTGHIVGRVAGGFMGGDVPQWAQAIVQAIRQRSPVETIDSPATTADNIKKRALAVSPLDTTETHAWVPFTLYPPTSYVGGAAGLAIANFLSFDAVERYYFGRVTNATLAVLIAALALFLAKHCRLILFVYLSLPMTVFLFGSYSQDAEVISFTALAVALATRILHFESMAKYHIFVGSLLLGFVVAAKAPYAPMLLVIPTMIMFGGGSYRNRAKLVLYALPGALFAGIWILHQSSLMHGSLHDTVMLPAADPKQQMAFIVSDPVALVNVFFRSYVDQGYSIFKGVIGSLGSMFVTLPTAIYLAVLTSMILAIVMDVAVGKSSLPQIAKIIVLALAAAAAALMILSLYLYWSEVKALSVSAQIQGRYFIPILIIAAVVLVRTETKTPSKIACIVVAGIAATANLLAVFTLIKYYSFM